MKLKDKRCDKCYWWDTETHPIAEQGECRGNPPKMVEDQDYPRTTSFYFYVWPYTTAIDKCSCFALKEEY